MVAKLKTSFLKSGFQLFCHKTLFSDAQEQPNNAIENGSKTRIKSSIRFSSSPNLTISKANNPIKDDTEATKDYEDANVHSKTSQNRSLSASGRVIEDEKSLNNNKNAEPPEINQKPQKKIPKYLAKSKLNNLINEQKNSVIIQNFMDDPAYIESHKTRSKSSTCVNREDLYGERSTVQCREPENHEHREPKFHRHSFPNHNFENSLDIPLIDKEINGGEYKNTSQHINGYNQAPLNPEFMIVNEDNQEIPLQRNQNANNSFSGGDNLYKNNKSLNNIKLAKKMHHLENNNNENLKSNVAENIAGQTIISGGAHVNVKKNNISKKPIIFNSKNGLINSHARLHTDQPSTTNSILSKKNLSKSSILAEKSRSNYEKKAVRFADSLGLELESIITLHQSDSGLRRRVIRLNNPSPAHHHYINSNIMVNNKGLAYTTNTPEKFNFTKVYNPKPNYSNIAQFQIEKNLRRQDNIPRRYQESINQFEDPNGPCLYDDIINKIAFSTDNSNSNQYRYPLKKFHDYENEANNKNAPTNRIYMSSSDKNINEHLRGQVTNNDSNNVHLPYYLLNKGQYSNSSDAINRQQPRHGNKASDVRSKNINSSGSNIPQNITITTRINNGKLESEV